MAGKKELKALTKLNPIFEAVFKFVNGVEVPTVPHSKYSRNLAELGVAELRRSNFSGITLYDHWIDYPILNSVKPVNEIEILMKKYNINSSSRNYNDIVSRINEATHSDPVSMVTGEELLTLDDGELAGYLPFKWQRTYRTSLAEVQGILGYGWTHSLNHYLIAGSEGVTWYNDKGLTFSLPSPTKDHLVTSNLLAGVTLALGDEDSDLILTQTEGQGQYHFNFSGNFAHLTAITDRHGNRLSVEYNREGQLLRLKQSDNIALGFIYNEAGLLVQTVRQERVKQAWQTQKVLATYHYNEHKQLIKADNVAGESEYYDYRDDNVIIRRQMAGGAEFNWQWQGAGSRARCERQWGNFGQLDETYQWSDDNLHVKVIMADGSTQVYRHDKKALLVEEVKPGGATIRQEFDENGQLISRIDGEGNTYRYVYNENGQLSAEILPDGSEISYQYVFNDLRKVTLKGRDGNIRQWLYRHNENGDIIEAEGPDGLLTRYTYNQQGKVTGILFPDGQKTEYEWDESGRLLKEQSPQQLKCYGYNGIDVLPVSVSDGINVIELAWNDAGQLIKVTLPDKKVLQYRYNAYGKVTEFTDEAGQITRYEYAAPLYLLTKQYLPNGDILTYRYDNIHLQVSEIENQKGERYQFSYTADGLLSEETGFDGVKTVYRYNHNGLLTEKAEYGNQHDEVPLVTVYERDSAGRLLKKVLADGSEVAYGYTEFGELSQVTDSGHVLAWEYDKAGRLTAEHQNWATLRHRYDEQTGMLNGTKLPDGQWLEYHHRGGQLRGITLDGQPLAAFHWDNQGRERERRQGNGLVNRYHYDVNSRLAGHQIYHGFDIDTEVSPRPRWQQQYIYEAGGELSVIKGDSPRYYQYDAKKQLSVVTYPGSHREAHHADKAEVFYYDATGNRISDKPQTSLSAYRDRAKGNRLAFFADRHFEYDRFGNLIAERRGKGHKLLTTYEYDCRHRLIKHTAPDGRVTTYAYDTFNRRISKTVDGEKTEFIWQGNRLIAESRQNDKVWQSYIYEPDSFRPLALVEGHAKKSTKTRTFWYQNDQLGSPIKLTDSLGDTVYECEYNAYGQLTEERWPLADNHIKPINPLRLPGQYFDEESGLHYNLNRYYDPGTGRYITQDPLGIAGGLNPYQYCQNPVNWIDPLGLFNVSRNGFEGVVGKGTNQVKPIVIAELEINGKKFIDTNQTARAADKANVNEPTLIADKIRDKEIATGKVLPNGNMANAHAEIGVIQQTHIAGLAKGADLKITVTGKEICSYCRSDIVSAAKAADAKSVTIYEEKTGLTYYWRREMKKLEVQK